MKPLDEDLVRAAELLEQGARMLYDSFTCRGKWVSSDGGHLAAKQEHDEQRRIARRLRKVVGTL
jgi:hypothetical protein